MTSCANLSQNAVWIRCRLNPLIELIKKIWLVFKIFFFLEPDLNLIEFERNFSLLHKYFGFILCFSWNLCHSINVEFYVLIICARFSRLCCPNRLLILEMRSKFSSARLNWMRYRLIWFSQTCPKQRICNIFLISF